MGRPQKPLYMDGSPAREFAFWLRDLRKRSGLTYVQLGKNAHYATSTMQMATAGNRFPTLRVTMAIVKACGGDTQEWRDYWTQVQRALDHSAPAGFDRQLVPPWAQRTSVTESGAEDQPDTEHQPDTEDPPDSHDPADGWFVESFAAVLRLDAEPVEALEQRRIVVTAEDLRELATSLSVPRHPQDNHDGHGLDCELLYGGSLQVREQPYESFFRNVIVLPRPLHQGERHQYALRMSIPPGQRMAPHYVHVPFRRSDHFDLHVRFSPLHLPRSVWLLRAVPTAVIYERDPAAEMVAPDRFGDVHVSFRDLRPGLGYGVSWRE
jgi:hypothetical protein